MRNVVIAIAAVILCASICYSYARPRANRPQAGIGFYNVENLYDTIPSLFYDDNNYTPTGKNNWGGQRYHQKLSNLSKVIDAMNMDIIGLAEVESEQALKDLVMTLKTDYNYIHRSSSDTRGMDVALLYKGDKFIANHIAQIPSACSREFLYVRGELLGERIDVVVCHMPSAMNSYLYRSRAIRTLHSFADSLQQNDLGARMIIMGDFNANPFERIMRENFETGRRTMQGMPFMYNPLGEYARKGFGSYVYQGQWNLYDNIFISTNFVASRTLRYLRSGIFIRDYMLESDRKKRRGYPLRTIASSVYLGGFSDHLPVFIYLEQ